MGRLIDAGALIAEMHNVILEDGDDRSIFYEVIERQPTIEQPEIIRCRDCKYNDMPPTAGNAGCTLLYGMTNQNGFCSLAERREGNE